MAVEAHSQRTVTLPRTRFVDLLPGPLRSSKYGEHLMVTRSQWERCEVEMQVTERLEVDFEANNTLHHILARPDFPHGRPFPNLKILRVFCSKPTIHLIHTLLNAELQALTLEIHPPYPSMEDIEMHLDDIQRISSLQTLWVHLVDNPDPSILAPWAERLFTWIPDKHRIKSICLFGCTASRDLQELVAACRYLNTLGIRAADPALGNTTAIGSLLKNLWTISENVTSLHVTIPLSLHRFDMGVLLRFSHLSTLTVHIEGTQRPNQLEALTQLTHIQVARLRIPHLHTDLDHGMLVALAEAWPDLETLDVAEPENGPPAETPLPNLHIGSLAVLPIHCPKLKHLRIVVNTSRATSMLPVPSSRYGEHELVLDLTDTLLDASTAEHTLHFLSGLFPSLELLTVGKPKQAWEAAARVWKNLN